MLGSVESKKTFLGLDDSLLPQESTSAVTTATPLTQGAKRN